MCVRNKKVEHKLEQNLIEFLPEETQIYDLVRSTTAAPRRRLRDILVIGAPFPAPATKK